MRSKVFLMVKRMGLWQRPSSSWAIAIISLTALMGCQQAQESTEPTEPEAVTPEIQIVTTIIPITQFTEAVAGDRAEVLPLLPPQVSPHEYQAKPTDVQAIAEAEVIVINGLGMETFLDNLIKNSGNQDIAIVDSSEGITPYPNQDKGIKDHDDHNHDGEAAPTDEHGHDHGEFNPHIWLDPKLAIQQVKNIRDGLIKIDPAGAADYTNNAEVYIKQLQGLDQTIASALEPYQGRTFVTFHDFAPYFAQSYGLQGAFLVAAPEETPGPDDIKRILEIAKQNKLQTLITEPALGNQSFASLAGDLGIGVGVFDPIETGDAMALKPEAYFSIMNNNLKTIIQTFQAPAN
ncbi:MAG: zinc ABC transporter solute-binding protein [Synechococcaceae cyanobacterium RL_1_2]|nr:zinc ABC transporter solute-binding protein [Synechococcaceae cyanobacterium RL_1_2]